MQTHLKFPSGEQRKFVETVFAKSGMNANGLAKIVNVSTRTIRDWKREKYNMTKHAVHIFAKIFSIPLPKDENKFVADWQELRFKASQIGGNVYFSKYGVPGTIESRKRGGIAGLTRLRELGLAAPVRQFASPLQSVDLAEFVGIMLGDGNIGRLQIEITLNSIVDADYSIFVLNLCNKLFGCFPKIIKRKDCNALSIYYNGINLVKFLTEIGMIVGNKVKQQVGVPDWIKDKIEYKTACVRSLMDTDGGVYIHTYKVNGKYYSYKNICFTNRSVPLLHFIYDTLNELGFTAKIVENVENKRVWLYNTHEVDRYLRVVKSSNQRLNRYINYRVGSHSLVHCEGLLIP